MPALTLEDGMPHINNVVPRLRYSSIKDWDSVYNWYRELAKGRYTADTDIAAKVDQLTKHLTTIEAKIQAIYHFVATNIRYVGIELGQSAYQPSPANEVFRMQYGDCKDKTTLLISMLDVAGIKGYPVLVSVAPYERVDTALPALNQFNHMIAAIPTGTDTYIWMDPTSSTCRYRDLPDNVQGRTGFLISDTHGEFVEVPVFPPESNQLVSTTELTLNNEGGVQGTLYIQTKGQYDLNARWAYQQIHPSLLKSALATELSQQFPGIQIAQHNISDLNDLNVPVKINVGFHVADYATRVGDHMLLPLPIDEFADYAETFATEQRTYSLDIGYPMQIEKTIRIEIPDRWTATLPKDIHHVVEDAELTRQYKQVGNIITYRLIFTVKNRIVSAAAYSAARALFNALASEDGARLLLHTGDGNRMSRK